MAIGDIGIVEKLAAIGKTVRRHIEDAHDLRLVEPHSARAQLQRLMGTLKVIPLRLHCTWERSQRGLEFSSAKAVARDNPASIAFDQRKTADIDQPAGKPQRIALLALRAFGKRDGSQIEGRNGQGSVPSK